MEEQGYENEKYLVSTLLDDDDAPTSSSLPNEVHSDCQFPFSAPPLLFDLGYRIEEDFFDENSKSTAQIHRAFSPVKSSTSSFHEDQLDWGFVTGSSMRKLSLQHDDYGNYEAIQVPTFHQLREITPEEEVLSHIAFVGQWARDQYGSRKVQNVLQNGKEEIVSEIFERISFESIDLMYDKFGNYVMQKLFQRGLPQHREALLAQVTSNFMQLSFHCFGCRVVQKAIEFAAYSETHTLKIVKLIQPRAIQFITNQNGNHIVQRCFQVLRQQHLETLLEEIIVNLPALAVHAYGCRVVQRYLECGTKQTKVQQILQILINMTLRLSQCQYGNYIMQYIVSNRKGCLTQISQIMSDNFVLLSCNKFASNVMEKIIKMGTVEFRNKVIDEVISKGTLVELAKHQYGNYVVQSLMQKTSKQRRIQMKAFLRGNSTEISNTQYGRHVLTQLDKCSR